MAQTIKSSQFNLTVLKMSQTENLTKLLTLVSSRKVETHFVQLDFKTGKKEMSGTLIW